jgi:hypothetical protein
MLVSILILANLRTRLDLSSPTSFVHFSLHPNFRFVESANMTSRDHAITLTLLNLTDIFGQEDSNKRLKAISNLWSPSSEVLFVDATGVFKSHQAISDMVDKITSMGGPDDQFISLGTHVCLKELCCVAD